MYTQHLAQPLAHHVFNKRSSISVTEKGQPLAGASKLTAGAPQAWEPGLGEGHACRLMLRSQGPGGVIGRFCKYKWNALAMSH